MEMPQFETDPSEYRERRTVEVLDVRDMTRALLSYCFKEGARQGFLYGAVYGVFFFIIGALFGCIYGLIAGMAAGLLNGLALSIVNANQRKHARRPRHFLQSAAYVAPPMTFVTCYLVFRLLVRTGFDFQNGVWWKPDIIYDVIPSLIAAYLAWRAVRDMEKWYLE